MRNRFDIQLQQGGKSQTFHQWNGDNESNNSIRTSQKLKHNGHDVTVIDHTSCLQT